MTLAMDLCREDLAIPPATALGMLWDGGGVRWLSRPALDPFNRELDIGDRCVRTRRTSMVTPVHNYREPCVRN
jgi:hypothetical protein